VNILSENYNAKLALLEIKMINGTKTKRVQLQSTNVTWQLERKTRILKQAVVNIAIGSGATCTNVV
jgi:hypothetical protein